MKGKSLLLFGVGAISVVAGWEATALANPQLTPGTQTALPIAAPGAGVYTLVINVPYTPAPTTHSIQTIAFCRDDTSPCVRISIVAGAGGVGAAPFNVAGNYWFTYRPDLDPCQAPLSGTPSASNIDLMSEWTACVAVEQAMAACRPTFNAGVGAIAPNLTFYIDPATAVAAPTPGLFINEFYKFDIDQ